jgi:hypothetical protein
VRKPAASRPRARVGLPAGDAAGEPDADHGAAPRGLDRVLHELRDGERADAAGHRRQGARDLRDGRRVHVAREDVSRVSKPSRRAGSTSSRARREVAHAVHAHVDHGRAGFT